jgi:hypothetical protein
MGIACRDDRVGSCGSRTVSSWRVMVITPESSLRLESGHRLGASLGPKVPDAHLGLADVVGADGPRWRRGWRTHWGVDAQGAGSSMLVWEGTFGPTVGGLALL